MADILTRKKTHFVLWHPQNVTAPPGLVIGKFQSGNPPQMADPHRFSLSPEPAFCDLFAISALHCRLEDGQVYHYWFEVEDSAPGHTGQRVLTTDPFAFTVDWRLGSPRMPPPFPAADRQPAGVVKFRQGALVVCDPGGEEPDFTGDPRPDTLPRNNQLVIYELPTAWSRLAVPDDLDIGVGTFRDVLALIDADSLGVNFDDLDVTQLGRSYLTELGVNALELLPPADSFFKREWGYDTAHYLAPDAELGFPEEFSSSTANSDLAQLVRVCHQKGIRFFIDVVMAFARHEPYQTINFDAFYINDPKEHPSDPDAHNSRPDHGLRDGFGSVLFRYAQKDSGYDPISGQQQDVLFPARQLMFTYLTRWMRDFRVDGVRMDSVENVANWDFVRDFKDHARQLFQERWTAQGLGGSADAHMLVVGEELSLPLQLLTENRLDGLWNDSFRLLVRAAIVGQSDGNQSFEATVRNLIDCRNLGFRDGAQAVNYITSHDVEGERRERLFNYLSAFKLSLEDIEKRAKLAFVCLLTAVGIPMILAGDEFVDEHDRFDKNGNVDQAGGKQVDPVNYARLHDAILDNGQLDPKPPMRRCVLAYVSRLVKLRTTHPALSVNDTDFIHVDFSEGKRVLAWSRGGPGNEPLVVVANFSDFMTADPFNPSSEYVVHNWPATPPGHAWREVTQDRSVPQAFVGREPIFPWEAKVYTLA